MPGLIAANVRRAIGARLVDPVNGYNAAILQFAGQLGITLPSVDFASPLQFFQAQADEDLFEDGTTFAYPLIKLYCSLADNNRPRQQSRTFSGIVTMGLEVAHSWSVDTVQTEAFEDTGDVVEAAMYQIFNSHTAPGWLPPFALYEGSMKAQRFPVKAGGLGFLMRQLFTSQFVVYV